MEGVIRAYVYWCTAAKMCTCMVPQDIGRKCCLIGRGSTCFASACFTAYASLLYCVLCLEEVVCAQVQWCTAAKMCTFAWRLRTMGGNAVQWGELACFASACSTCARLHGALLPGMYSCLRCCLRCTAACAAAWDVQLPALLSGMYSCLRCCLGCTAACAACSNACTNTAAIGAQQLQQCLGLCHLQQQQHLYQQQQEQLGASGLSPRCAA
eukprot:866600-Pelagomonas_calceolata.AAC.2